MIERERKMKPQNPIGKTVNRFLLRTTAISAVFFVLAGTATVRQRAQEVNTGESYAVCSFIDSGSEIGIRISDKRLVVKKDALKKTERFWENFLELLRRG